MEISIGAADVPFRGIMATLMAKKERGGLAAMAYREEKIASLNVAIGREGRIDGYLQNGVPTKAV